MISTPCIEVQTTSENRFSVPAWFAEVVIIAGYLEKKGRMSAFAQQVRLVRGRFGTYEPIDFLALLIGYAISGERTPASFVERVEPFETAFMALFGRRCLPHRSSLSRFLADVDRPCLEAFRTLFQQHPFARCLDLGNYWRHLRAAWRAATSSLTSMRRVKPHGNERCPAIRRGHRHDADLMLSVRPATAGASGVRWSARARQRESSTRANGLAPMQAGAMGIIAGN
jgi:hypothetical protein